jgi:hypothetical protein
MGLENAAIVNTPREERADNRRGFRRLEKLGVRGGPDETELARGCSLKSTSDIASLAAADGVSAASRCRAPDQSFLSRTGASRRIGT